MDLIVPAGPGLPRGLVISGADLIERFSRSSGPGGQSVNTADSRVELEFDVAGSAALTQAERDRAVRFLGGRLTGGRLVVVASVQRSQRANRMAARQRMAELLAAALAPPPPTRRPTSRTRGSQRRRLQAKRIRSQTKTRRARPGPDD